MSFVPEQLKQIVEGALLAAGKPLTVQRLGDLFEDSDPKPGRDEIIAALEDIASECRSRSFEIVEVASGYRLQVKETLAPWVSRLWEEKPQRYSRALLETLALVAYRQPITRGEIEDIRGVAVSTNIVRTLLERDWVRVVGHREVPGRPAMYATTKIFLDYFNLKSLDELPSLAEIRDLDNINPELDFAPAAAAVEATILGLAPAPVAASAESAQDEHDPASALPVQLPVAGTDIESLEQAGQEVAQETGLVEVSDVGGDAQASDTNTGASDSVKPREDTEVTEVSETWQDLDSGQQLDTEAADDSRRELPSNVIKLPTS
jgi:segregation and condensation protein B